MLACMCLGEILHLTFLFMFFFNAGSCGKKRFVLLEHPCCLCAVLGELDEGDTPLHITTWIACSFGRWIWVRLIQ